MEKKQFSLIRIVNIVILVGMLALCLFTCVKISEAQTASGTTDTMAWVQVLLDMVCVAAGLMYLIFGYGKGAAMYFKLYMGCFALTQALLLAEMLMDPLSQPYYFGIIYLMAFTAVLILAFGKNLGRNISLILIGMLLIGGIAVAFVTLLTMTEFDAIARGINDFLFSVAAGLMVVAKYIDKAQRGSN